MLPDEVFFGNSYKNDPGKRKMKPIARILTLCPDIATARAIAAALLDARLVACANIGAEVESHYLWNNARQHETEIQLWLKTRADLIEPVSKTICGLHPYDVPMIAADNVEVNAEYADWVAQSTD